MSSQFGRYVPLEVVQHDWLGISYRAFDSAAQRPVALRLLRRAAGGTGGPRDGAAIVPLLRRSLGCGGERIHANVADVYEVGEVPEPPDVYIASEWIEGERLAALLAADAAIDRARAHLWMSQILRGLGAAHRRGLIHGDLNPSNVMVAAGDEIRLLDMGLYTREAFPAADESASAGWPLFISPEQNLGEAPGARSDMRAAGILLYRMIAGRMPFEGTTAAVARKVLTEDLPPLSALHAGWRALDDVIGRATARNARERYASTDEFLLALNRVEYEASSATSPLARSPAPPAAPSAPAEAATAWKLEAKASLAAALADVVGPMGPLLVEDALREATTLGQCHDILAARITDPAARAKLLLIRSRAGATDATVGESVAAAYPRGDWPLPAAAALELKAVLGEAIGPMAALLVDRAAARARSRGEFVDLLTGMLPVGVPSARWHTALRL